MSASISFTLHSNLNENPPEFTLTCRSKGGPVTTVTWKRNEKPVQEDRYHQTSQIIVDTSVSTVYHNTLRVKGREGGLYTCNVSNNIHNFISGTRASSFSSFILKGI